MTILLAIFAVLSLVLAFMSRDAADVGFYSFCSGVAIVTFVFGIWVVPLVKSEGYKKGQVDCMKGDIKYEMTTKKDTTWVEK